MNKIEFKKNLFKKNKSAILNIDLSSQQVSDDIEYYILANFFQSYLKGSRYLAENFTQNFWRWLSSDVRNINMILGHDNSSLHKIFPSCSNVSDYVKGGSDHFLCERKHLSKEDNIYRTILSYLGKHTYEQEKWAKSKGYENKSWIMSTKTKSYIARIKPRSEEDLLKKIFHFKYPKNMDRDGIATLDAVREGIANPRDDFGCKEGCGSTDIHCDGDYENYHF